MKIRFFKFSGGLENSPLNTHFYFKTLRKEISNNYIMIIQLYYNQYALLNIDYIISHMSLPFIITATI